MRSSADNVSAARLLVRVEGGAFLSRLLADGCAASVRVRVLGVLRWLRTLDTVLAPLCRRDLARLDPEVRAVLRIGLFEAMYLECPPALATDGGVHLVRRLGCGSASGMVNAVLRRATSGWRKVLEGTAIDVRLAHPEWLSHRWIEEFGPNRAEGAMASAQQPAVTWAWFLDESAPARLAAEGLALEPHPWCPGAWSAPDQVGRLIREVEAGAAYAQDPSSQVVAHVAARLSGGAGRFLDLCAAPGGKSALIVHLGDWDPALSGDRLFSRVRLMRPLLDRIGVAGVVAADAVKSPFKPRSWDLVLLDAPCSGTGTFRRHPELKWRLQPDAIARLAADQRGLLAAGLEMLAAEGVLVYATCSVEPEENEEVVRDLPAGFEHVVLEETLPDNVPCHPTTEGGVRILPNPDGDGFTMHAIRRSAPA